MKRNLCLTLIFVAALPVAAQDRPAMIDQDDHQVERQEWFYQQRKFPLTQIPAGARIRAVEAIKQMDRQKPAAKNRCAECRQTAFEKVTFADFIQVTAIAASARVTQHPDCRRT